MPGKLAGSGLLPLTIMLKSSGPRLPPTTSVITIKFVWIREAFELVTLMPLVALVEFDVTFTPLW